MTDWNAYIKENAVATETAWINKIYYLFATLSDGWVAVFEIGNSGELLPQIQASDMPHARSYCELREPITVPFNVIC